MPRRDRIAGGIVSVLGAGFAMLVAYALVFGVHWSADNRVINVVYCLVFPVPLVSLGLLLLRRFAEQCALCVTVSQSGVSVHTFKHDRSTSWDDVSALAVEMRRPPSLLTVIVVACFCWFLVLIYLLNMINPRLRYVLKLKDGDSIALPRALTGKGSLAGIIDLAIAGDKLPDAIERFRSGTPCVFGTFTAGYDGLRWRESILPWHELEAVVRSGPRISIIRTGQRQPWATASLRDVPNLTLFTALISTIHAPA